MTAALLGSLLAIDAAAEAIVCEGTALEVRPVQTAYLLTTALIRGSVLCSGEAKMIAYCWAHYSP